MLSTECTTRDYSWHCSDAGIQEITSVAQRLPGAIHRLLVCYPLKLLSNDNQLTSSGYSLHTSSTAALTSLYGGERGRMEQGRERSREGGREGERERGREGGREGES